MIVATYRHTRSGPGERKLAYVERFPSRRVEQHSRMVIAHPMGDEAIEHYRAQPIPTFDQRTNRVVGRVRSHTPFDASASW